jgi:hypothetical protein
MLSVINESLKVCEYSTSSIGIPEMRHFLYKSKTAAQVHFNSILAFLFRFDLLAINVLVVGFKLELGLSIEQFPLANDYLLIV